MSELEEVSGRPILGDKQYSSSHMVEQIDTKVFIKAMDTLLDHPNVKAVRWSQYTPGFNDGEPCTFNGHNAEVQLIGMNLTEDDAERELELGGEIDDESWFTEYDLYVYKNSAGEVDWKSGSRVYEVAGIDTKEIHELLGAFEYEVTSGAHDVWMNVSFGDPARIIATPEGFEVEHYDCGY